jgi:hypothetical protein
MSFGKNYETVTVGGHEVQTVDGECWVCEDGEPTMPGQVTVGGMLALKVGICEDCAEDDKPLES